GPSSELVLHVAAGDRNTPLPPPLPSPTPSHHSRRLELAARRRQAASGRAAPPQALQDFPKLIKDTVAVAPLFPAACCKNVRTPTPSSYLRPLPSSTRSYEVIQEQLEDQDAEQFRRRYQLTLAIVSSRISLEFAMLRV
ncbi:hypothetical protein EJB05_50621, partial [Eragrostis curvula]